MNHTPTPWHMYQPWDRNEPKEGEYWVLAADHKLGYVLASCHDLYVEPEKNKANAEFIIRACNSYDDLLEACNFAVSALAVWLIDPSKSPITIGEIVVKPLRVAIDKATQ